ncbi:MAG: FHA domain-containing protein [Planctomycetota bacterium]
MTTESPPDDTRIIDEHEGAPAKLVVRAGENRGAAHLLPKRGTFTIGRADTNDIVVDDPEVSRHHCRIIADENGYRIEDLRSFNGTFVDGYKAGMHELVSGAELRLGQTRFVLVLPDETRAVVPAASGFAAPAAPAADETSARKAMARRPRRPRMRLVLAAAAVLLLLAAAGSALYGRAALDLLAGRRRSVNVVSSPPAAEVFLDDEFLGLTPIDVEFAAAEPHALRVTKHGYETWRMAVGRHTPRHANLTLRPETAAVLLISASKADTAVFLDGRFAGKTGENQPLRIPGVSLGQHELRLEKMNYVAYRKRIDVTRAGSLRLYARLVSRQEAALLDLLAEEPDSALRNAELGHLYMVNKQFDKAMESYKKALELVYSRRDTSRYYGRLKNEIDKVMTGGDGLFDYGTPEETEIVREKLEDVFVSLAPKYREAQQWISTTAKSHAKREQMAKAARLYRKLLAVQPNEATVYYRLATYEMEQGDLTAAVTTLERAVAKFPESWAIQYRLGEAYSRRAAAANSNIDKQKALAHLEKAITLCTTPEYQTNIQHYIDLTKELKIP